MSDDNQVNNNHPLPSSGGDDFGPKGQLPSSGDNLFIIPPHPNTNFDDSFFLGLLQGSISLTLAEKKRVIDSIPRLSQAQIDELIKIFEEEKKKFSELEESFSEDVAKLKAHRMKELETEASRKEEEAEEADSEAEAERIKRDLGL